MTTPGNGTVVGPVDAGATVAAGACWPVPEVVDPLHAPSTSARIAAPVAMIRVDRIAGSSIRRRGPAACPHGASGARFPDMGLARWRSPGKPDVDAGDRSTGRTLYSDDAPGCEHRGSCVPPC